MERSIPFIVRVRQHEEFGTFGQRVQHSQQHENILSASCLDFETSIASLISEEPSSNMNLTREPHEILVELERPE